MNDQIDEIRAELDRQRDVDLGVDVVDQLDVILLELLAGHGLIVQSRPQARGGADRHRATDPGG